MARRCSIIPVQDGDNLKDALRYAAALLGELRTGELQPHRYFELYMQVCALRISSFSLASSSPATLTH